MECCGDRPAGPKQWHPIHQRRPNDQAQCLAKLGTHIPNIHEIVQFTNVFMYSGNSNRGILQMQMDDYKL